MPEYRLKTEGIDCPHCAGKLAEKAAEIEGVLSASADFEKEILTYSCAEDKHEEIEGKITEMIRAEEPEVKVYDPDEEHHHEHEHHEHEHHEHHHHGHEEAASYIFEVKGIDCPNCAKKLEAKIAAVEDIRNVVLDYDKSTLTYECAHHDGKRNAETVMKIIAEEEPEAEVTSKGHVHLHNDECSDESCSCHEHHHHEHEHHEHHHDHEEVHAEGTEKYRFSVTGIDCANCAAGLEREIAGLDGVYNCHIDFMNSSLVYECLPENAGIIEQKMRRIITDDEPEAVIEKITGLKTYRLKIAGIDCADCAERLARRAMKIDGVEDASSDFMNEILSYSCLPVRKRDLEEKIIRMIADEEPEVKVTAVTESRQKKPAEEEEKDTVLPRLAAGAVLFVIGLLLHGLPQTVVCLAAYLVLGYDVLQKAVRNIGRGQVFDEHFLMAVATAAAIYLKDYREAAGVMLFYQIGEYFQARAVRSSRKSISALMDIRPDYAYVKRDGEYLKVDPDEVGIGEIVRVRPGERIPLDGRVISGASSLNTASLTGESKARDVDVNDEVISGCVNETGVLEIEVQKEYGESTVSRILDLVENNESNKAKTERFITKFARYYTPAVVFAAIAVAAVTALLTNDVRDGIERACTFLVISCPCALVISIPLSFFAGIGGLSSRGILVKGAGAVEVLAETDTVVMDKTGTLTSGEFAVAEVRSSSDPEQTLKDAAYAEYFSNHPVAAGIRRACGETVHEEQIADVQEIAGRGVSVNVMGRHILAGNYKLMAENNIECRQETSSGTLVYVASDGIYEGCIVLQDQFKPDAAKAVRQLHEAGRKVVIVSGDSAEITAEAAEALGADQAFGGCLPAEKVETVRKLKETGRVLFVGDGVNDAPVLAAADAGAAMGALGSDAAIEAADVVIMDDQPAKAALLISACQRIMKVARQNIVFAIGIKALTLVLGAFGIANMWMAIFADTGVAMLCVLNSLRLLHIGGKD
ncbi:MAG: cadmium-translocating P-type ATPase [Solobacterium sp.]|nr:cadmium-translocating P-type ATPase [Solobacterium sp.]